MNQRTKAQDTVTLQLETLFDMVDELELEADSGHTVYGTRSMLKLYLYMLVKRIKGFKTLASQLRHRGELLERFGLANVPHRTTLSRRFKQLPLVLREQIRRLRGRGRYRC